MEDQETTARVKAAFKELARKYPPSKLEENQCPSCKTKGSWHRTPNMRILVRMKCSKCGMSKG